MVISERVDVLTLGYCLHNHGDSVSGRISPLLIRFGRAHVAMASSACALVTVEASFGVV